MNGTLDCLPCFIRQALEACRICTHDAQQQAKLMQAVSQQLAATDLSLTPPAVARDIHNLLKRSTGIADPYAQAKQQQNQLALALAPSLQQQIQASPSPLKMATALAIAGNVIDLGVKNNFHEDELMATIKQAVDKPLTGNYTAFETALKNARNILYLLDNAGEVVFDGLLMQQIGPHKITAVTRGAPILNDVTRDDVCALPSGIELIDNGSDIPGTWLQDCADEFIARFEAADMVIAKGQGNYETLSDTAREVFFLFKVKCPVVANLTNQPLGSHLMIHHTGEPS